MRFDRRTIGRLCVHSRIKFVKIMNGLGKLMARFVCHFGAMGSVEIAMDSGDSFV